MCHQSIHSSGAERGKDAGGIMNATGERGMLAAAAISHEGPTREPPSEILDWLGTYSHQVSARSRAMRLCKAKVKAPVSICLAAPLTAMCMTLMLSTKAIREESLQKSGKQLKARHTAKSSPMTIWVDLMHNFGYKASGTVATTPLLEDWLATIAHSFMRGPPDGEPKGSKLASVQIRGPREGAAVRG